MTATLDDLFGLPFKRGGRGAADGGIDCWGVVLIAARRFHGRELPDLSREAWSRWSDGQTARLAQREEDAGGWEEVEAPAAGVVVFAGPRPRMLTHAGYLIDEDLVATALEHRGALVETLPYYAAQWPCIRFGRYRGASE